jgi:hypothetical protein
VDTGSSSGIASAKNNYDREKRDEIILGLIDVNDRSYRNTASNSRDVFDYNPTTQRTLIFISLRHT